MNASKKIYLCTLCSCLLFSSCSASNNLLPILKPVNNEISGAASEFGKVNIENSPYYKNINFYNCSPTSTLIKLKNFKTYQQTSEYSCGSACVLMALNYFGISNVSEDALVKEMDVRSHENPRDDGSIGATTQSIVDAFKNRRLNVTSSFDTQNESGISVESEKDFYQFITQKIKANNAILIENVEFGGHWRVIIGYDDMGKPEETDTHVVILADPYDTTDHNQNGYTIESASRLFSSWFDHNVMPPNQQVQQYVCVSKN